MANTIPSASVFYNGDGSTTQYPVTFEYLDKAYVVAEVGGVVAEFTWVSDNTIEFTEAPATGALNVHIYRTTAADAMLAVFSEDTPFLPKYVDKDYTQLLHLIQEVNSTSIDRDDTEAAAREAADDAEAATREAADTALGASIAANFARTLRTPDAVGAIPYNAAARANKLISFDSAGNPTVMSPASGSAADVMTQLASAAGASYVGFTQTGSSLLESVQSKLRQDAPTPDDFFYDGDADYAAAFARAIAASTALYVPAGRTYTVSSAVTINKDGFVLFGEGTIQSTGSDMVASAIVYVRANDCTVAGIHIDNPELLYSVTGERQYGISIHGHRNHIRGCRVTQCSTGIAVRSDGEWYNNSIVGNFVLDCIGSGLVSDMSGLEDRGYGVVSWGAYTSIVGNHITCMSGRDACIGISLEALNGSAPTPGVDPHACAVVANNFVQGSFRRGIAVEGVQRYSITGNTLGGGFTWWGLCVVQNSTYGTITGNTIYATRDPDISLPWSPPAAAVYFYCNQTAYSMDTCVFANNTVVCALALRGIYIVGASGGYVNNIDLLYNTLVCEASANTRDAIQVQNSIGTRIVGNKMQGAWNRMVESSTTTNLTVRDNVGPKATGSDYYISAEGGATVVDGNVCTDGAGVIAFGSTVDLPDVGPNNRGFGTIGGVYFSTANVQDATYRLNTFGKYAGKMVIANGHVCIATGSAATSGWLRQTDGTTLTPA